MHLLYIDDSGDDQVYGFVALAIPIQGFRPVLLQIKELRRRLRQSDGIYINREFHAVDFVAGRGRIADRVVTKWRRCEIFRETVALATRLPGVRLFCAFGSRDQKLRTLERLINRINRAMREWESHGVLFFDEGEEKAYTKLVRKMGVYNPIRSAYGRWPNGSEYQNMPIESVVEDPSFRRSKQSYFIQLADFCGYALLQYERPTSNPRRQRYRLHDVFPTLEPICVPEASPHPFGIIRT
ncbi:MAG: DUF3800 domain-containing protein [Bryobacterales bacterium]